VLENGWRQGLDIDIDIDIDLASQYTRTASNIDAMGNGIPLGARRYWLTSSSKTVSIKFGVQKARWDEFKGSEV
jgi:hypothetical protein